MITANEIKELRNKIIPVYENIVEDGLEEIKEDLIRCGEGEFMIPYAYIDDTCCSYINRSLQRRGFIGIAWPYGNVTVQLPPSDE